MYANSRSMQRVIHEHTWKVINLTVNVKSVPYSHSSSSPLDLPVNPSVYFCTDTPRSLPRYRWLWTKRKPILSAWNYTWKREKCLSFQQSWIDSHEPVQSPFKLRDSKWCSVGSLTTLIEYSSDLQRLWSDCGRLIRGFAGTLWHIPHFGNLMSLLLCTLYWNLQFLQYILSSSLLLLLLLLFDHLRKQLRLVCKSMQSRNEKRGQMLINLIKHAHTLKSGG